MGKPVLWAARRSIKPLAWPSLAPFWPLTSSVWGKKYRPNCQVQASTYFQRLPGTPFLVLISLKRTETVCLAKAMRMPAHLAKQLPIFTEGKSLNYLQLSFPAKRFRNLLFFLQRKEKGQIANSSRANSRPSRLYVKRLLCLWGNKMQSKSRLNP